MTSSNNSLTNDNRNVYVTEINSNDHVFLYRFEGKARYTVHRQNKGTFTPMTFDFSTSFYGAKDLKNQDDVKSRLEKVANTLWRPYLEHVLFMDIDSPFIVEFLKGQNLGFQRKRIMDDIRKIIAEGKIWYSLNDTPPLTLQNQRVVSYDVNNSSHGSMLDPVNVLNHVSNRILQELGIEGVCVSSHVITDGYTEKQQ